MYTKPSSGAGDEQLLLESRGLFNVPYGWSANGRMLLYREVDPKTNSDLWALPIEGDRKPLPVAVSPFNEQSGAFSPDGRWVAYQSNESGRDEVYVVPFPGGGGRWQVSTEGGVWPLWRHDGKALFFIGPERGMMAAAITASGARFDAAPPVRLFEAPIVAAGFARATVIGVKPQYAVSADGRFLITVPLEDSTSASMTLLQNWMPSRSQ